MGLKPGASALLACCILVTSCSGLPPREQSVAAYVRGQKNAAVAAQEQGRYAAALTLWRSILPLVGDDGEALEKLGELEGIIAARVTTALARGEAAYAADNRATGDLWMLRVLALEPGHRPALEYLRASASRHAYAQQTAKNYQERMQVVAQPEPEGQGFEAEPQAFLDAARSPAVIAPAAGGGRPTREQAAPWVRRAYVALADTARQRRDKAAELEHLLGAMEASPRADDPLLPRSTSLRQSLSDDWYRQGSSSLQGDLQAAIEALEKSVAYNPDNSAARQQLKKARLLKRNLEKIRSQ